MKIAHTWRGEPVGPDEAVELVVWAVGGGLELRVDAPWHADPPPPGPPGPTWGLWEHEVVEWFLVGEGQPVPYLELELGPHGHHLVLELAGVRQPVRRELPLQVSTRIDAAARRWTATAFVPASLLPPPPWRANAFALHGAGSDRRYLAAHPVAHLPDGRPADAPDFHRLYAFPPWSPPAGG